MKFFASKEALLPAIMSVSGVVEKKQTMPVLSNLMLHAAEGSLTITSTDLDIEMKANCVVDVQTPGTTTLPAKKLLDICRNLSDDVTIEIDCVNENTAMLKAGRGRYKLQTLPADEFPNLENVDYQFELTIAQYQLQKLFSRTQFSMALQDVRYYLNGLLLEISDKKLRAVATDAHRLSLADASIDFSAPELSQYILPRKAVLELSRIFNDNEDLVSVRFGRNHLTFTLPDVVFTTKLVDHKYANYEKAIPDMAACEYKVIIDRTSLQQMLTRVSVLSQEKIKGVSLHFENNLLTIKSYNNENEEAEEAMDIEFSGDAFTLTFNASYVSDFLSTSETETVTLYSSKANSSTVITDTGTSEHLYVVMPMKF
ncbi:MAG: DNA polymerase III subunit beta [Methylococcales bacterium]|jgi:DNA polymerase III subunit beta|nr:DNA polymerase III subunit beta [Methylococcales bacterium]MBT7445036.1 DNA polymerase III subunit beta [Methylococcales bacterium]